jgi:stearoyl-CoA desaturase (delta-9 desaturase)
LPNLAIQPTPGTPRRSDRPQHGDILYPSAIPFVVVHLSCFAAIWSGVSLKALALCGALYGLRMFGVCAGYHRYFSHRAFATSRLGQFVLAVLAQSSAQSSVLWWAAKHRHHHRFSDTEHDLHSPLHRSFLYSHLGWLFDRPNRDTDMVQVEDLARFPELRWLHRFELAPAISLALLSFAIAGWSGLVVGFLWSTVLVYHATFCINSLAHVRGRVRYVTGDGSRNNALLALLTLGEGWHNNHHAFQSSARQGFRWWEFDPTYYVLLGLARLRLVWDLKSPPPNVVANTHPLGSRVVQRAAEQLASAFNADMIAVAVRSALPEFSVAELQARLAEARQTAGDELKAFCHTAIPSREAVLAKARSCLPRTPSLDEIVDRAHALVLAGVGARLALGAAD